MCIFRGHIVTPPPYRVSVHGVPPNFINKNTLKMSTETKNSVLASANELKKFNKGLNLLSTSREPIWSLDEASAIWVEAHIVKGKNSNSYYLKPTAKGHGNFYNTHNDDNFKLVNQLGPTAEDETGLPVLVKLAKQSPLDLEESFVEEQFKDNPNAIANWKQAIAKNAQRLVAIIIDDEIEEE